MCRSNRAQRLQQQQLLESSLPINSRPRGCCSRKQQRVRRDLEDHAVINYRTTDANKTHSQAAFGSAVRGYHCPMAAMIAVGIGMGVEKLGRKISEKRIERKDKKAATQREVMYGHGESSNAHAALRTNASPKQEKSEEALREHEWSGRRRSVSSERTLLPDYAPPAYEEVVRNNSRRA